jgi:hypothetical protein
MTKLEWDSLHLQACDYSDIFAHYLSPHDPLEELKTDFKFIYWFADFSSVLWAKQYLVLNSEPFQIAVDNDEGEYVILCNVPWEEA